MTGVDARRPPWRKVHFVGIGGAGMCALAELLLADGCAVSGSDMRASAATRRLGALGAKVRVGHDPVAVEGAETVVVSTAIADANVELRQARRLGLPVLARGELLARLMRGRRGIAVAGSHGKTTTAGFVASVLRAGGLDPSFAIGGTMNETGGNGHRGAGRQFVVEGDESDGSFLRLRPQVAVVTNIDSDHLDTYGQDFQRLRGAFADFLGALPADGAAVVCADDPHAVLLARTTSAPAVTYGFADSADVRVAGFGRGGHASGEMAVARRGASTLAVSPPLPGCHNIRNALAAIAVATLEGVADNDIAQGLAAFAGLRRRFEIGERVLGGRRITVVDDYGHHPTEIAGVVAAARRRWRGRRLVMVYQPHRFTRLRDLCDEFARELAAVDRLLLVDVYAAGEAPIAGVDGELLRQAVARCGVPAPPLFATPEAAFDHLAELAREGDVVIAQGAGDIDRLPALLGDAA